MPGDSELVPLPPPISEAGQVAGSPGNLLPYDLQDEIEVAIEAVRYNTMVTFSRLATTYQMAAHCAKSGLEGDFVECGVWKGGAMGVMAAAQLRHGGQRNLRLFDSFDDLCQPDETIDGARAVQEARNWGHQIGSLNGLLEPMAGFYDQFGGAGSAEECRALLDGKLGYPAEDILIHEGWFQDTIPALLDQLDTIAILRIDCDYYQSTRYCLNALYPRVASGGFVIIDDYGWYEGCRQAVNEFLHLELGGRVFLNHADADGRYLIKP